MDFWFPQLVRCCGKTGVKGHVGGGNWRICGLIQQQRASSPACFGKVAGVNWLWYYQLLNWTILFTIIITCGRERKLTESCCGTDKENDDGRWRWDRNETYFFSFKFTQFDTQVVWVSVKWCRCVSCLVVVVVVDERCWGQDQVISESKCRLIPWSTRTISSPCPQQQWSTRRNWLHLQLMHI